MKTIFEKNPKEKFLQMSKEDFSASIKKSAQKYISEEFKGSFAKKKSFEFYLDIMNDTLLTALSHMQEEMKASSFVPSGFELPVGVKMRDADKSQLRPIIIECGENLRINFTGTADRVDEFTDENGVKYIRIIDYKTGFKEFIAEQLALGINMQMFFYLFTLTDENGGRYEGAVPAGVLYMPVKYPSASNDRQADYGSISKCIEDTLKMQGAVLDSALIINAMEKDCCGKFIPVSFNKNGTISAKSSVIDSDVMNGIKELSKRLLQEMGKAVFEGNVPASPFESKKLKCTLPCEYCDYKDICGNYPNPVLRDISDVDMSLFEKE